jgi:hypothetical protein
VGEEAEPLGAAGAVAAEGRAVARRVEPVLWGGRCGWVGWGVCVARVCLSAKQVDLAAGCSRLQHAAGGTEEAWGWPIKPNRLTKQLVRVRAAVSGRADVPLSTAVANGRMVGEQVRGARWEERGCPGMLWPRLRRPGSQGGGGDRATDHAAASGGNPSRAHPLAQRAGLRLVVVQARVAPARLFALVGKRAQRPGRWLFGEMGEKG